MEPGISTTRWSRKGMEKGGAARRTSSGQITGLGQPRVEDWQVSEPQKFCPTARKYWKRSSEDTITG